MFDTSALLSDLAHRVKTGMSTKLGHALLFGYVLPLSARHVWAEVPRKIPTEAAEFGIDADEAEAVWWAEYNPYIRFVDVDSLPEPEGLAELTARDISDVPTAKLVGLLVPVFAFSTDKDLGAFTTRLWVEPAQTATIVGAFDTAAYGAGSGVKWVVDHWEEICGRARSVRDDPRARVLALGGGLLLALNLLFNTEATVATLGRVMTTVGRAAQGTARTLGEAIATRLGMLGAIAQASSTAPTADPAVVKAARLLSSAPGPVWLERLVSMALALSESPEPRSAEELAALIEGCSAFVEVEPGRYELGRTMTSFIDAVSTPVGAPELALPTQTRGEAIQPVPIALPKPVTFVGELPGLDFRYTQEELQ